MLSDQEKQDMFHDGLNLRRRMSFASQKSSSTTLPSFDDYLRFLTSIQNVFPAFPNSSKIITKFNKL